MDRAFIIGVVAIVIFGLAMLHPVTQILAGVFTGFMIITVIILAVSPLYAPGLTNKPQNGERSGFHLFTFIEPGQVKLVTRGEDLVRMIMNTDGKKFRRAGPADEYWKIEDGETNDPLIGIHPLVMPWARYIYKTTGAVFTGIWPFQQVREYRLERTKLTRKEKQSDGEHTVGVSNLHLVVTEDYSDHVRLREFLYPMHITGAESKDKIPLDIIGVAKMAVRNPYKAAYGTDRWDHAVVNQSTNAIGERTKTLTLDESLTAENADSARGISRAVLEISDDLDVAGIDITGFDILEINPDLDAEGLAAIQAEALAKQKAKATRTDGDARADVIRALNKANQEGGDQSTKSMEAEAFVRAAEAAGKGGIVILSPSNAQQSQDLTQLAILAELRKLNQGK